MTLGYRIHKGSTLAAWAVMAGALTGALAGVAPAQAQSQGSFIGVVANAENPRADFDIDGDGETDMFATYSLSTDGRVVVELGGLAFFGAGQGELAMAADYTIRRYAFGDTVTAADFGAAPRNDGGDLWVQAWVDGALDNSAGNWTQVGDSGYASFRQVVDGQYRYGWVQITRGSVEVGYLGFGTTVGVMAVPEPATTMLALAGLVGVGAAVSRRRRSGSGRPELFTGASAGC